jgi:hypothetical protein
MSVPTYRYTLTRELRGTARPERRVAFVMLNPSTADETHDDATIRRCIAFARREGGTQLGVVNLYAARATDPRGLRELDDPVGPENDDALRWAAGWADLLIAAWGARAPASRVEQAVAILDRPLACLGVTKDGAPRHPLYLPRTAPLSPWAASPDELSMEPDGVDDDEYEHDHDCDERIVECERCGQDEQADHAWELDDGELICDRCAWEVHHA